MAKILVIDDDEGIRQLLERVLGMDGHEVTPAAEGNAGVRACGSVDFDLVISDVLMPNKDGIETILELRRLVPDMPIIAMSGGSSRIGDLDFLEFARRLGADVTLKKPFRRDALRDAVQTALENGGQGRARADASG